MGVFILNINVGRLGDWGCGWGAVIRSCNGDIERVTINQKEGVLI